MKTLFQNEQKVITQFDNIVVLRFFQRNQGDWYAPCYGLNAYVKEHFTDSYIAPYVTGFGFAPNSSAYCGAKANGTEAAWIDLNWEISERDDLPQEVQDYLASKLKAPKITLPNFPVEQSDLYEYEYIKHDLPLDEQQLNPFDAEVMETFVVDLARIIAHYKQYETDTTQVPSGPDTTKFVKTVKGTISVNFNDNVPRYDYYSFAYTYLFSVWVGGNYPTDKYAELMKILTEYFKMFKGKYIGRDDKEHSIYWDTNHIDRQMIGVQCSGLQYHNSFAKELKELFDNELASFTK